MPQARAAAHRWCGSIGHEVDDVFTRESLNRVTCPTRASSTTNNFLRVRTRRLVPLSSSARFRVYKQQCSLHSRRWENAKDSEHLHLEKFQSCYSAPQRALLEDRMRWKCWKSRRNNSRSVLSRRVIFFGKCFIFIIHLVHSFITCNSEVKAFLIYRDQEGWNFSFWERRVSLISIASASPIKLIVGGTTEGKEGTSRVDKQGRTRRSTGKNYTFARLFGAASRIDVSGNSSWISLLVPKSSCASLENGVKRESAMVAAAAEYD